MSIVIDYLPLFFKGLIITLEVSIGAFLCGLIISIICIFILHFLPRPIGKIVTLYIWLIRGLPELLIILVVYYGGTVLLTNFFQTYTEFNALIAGIFALSLVAGAYFTEILRAAIQTIPPGQKEASVSLGLNAGKTFYHVLMPQMFSFALPGISNQWLVLLKDSALVSFIGLPDLMFNGIQGANTTSKAMPFYITVALFYIFVTAISMGLISITNKRLRYDK